MKKLAILLIMCIFLTSFSTSAASFTDVEGMSCEKAVEVLYALGIVEGRDAQNFCPEESLTRAEMVTFLIRILAVEPGKGETLFLDVTPSHWAYAEVSAAYRMQVINGIDEKRFVPDKELSCSEAVKMIVSAMGYSVQADARGGYPSGYLYMAQQLGLLEGINNEGTFTRGDAAQLLYNALDMPLSERASYGSEKLEFKTESDTTILSKYLKVEKIKDTIAATAYIQMIAPPKNPAEDEAVLESGRIVEFGETDLDDFVGMPTELYLRCEEDADVPTVLAVFPIGKSKRIDVPAKRILGETDANSFVYETEEGKEKRQDITDATLIYNGRPVMRSAQLMQPLVGRAVLVLDKGGSVCAVRIESYVDAVVDYADERENAIYLKDNRNLNGQTTDMIDVGKNSVPVQCRNVSGEKIAFTDLAQGNIISIAVSLDFSVYNIVCSDVKFVGTITEKSDTSVIINETEYTVDSTIANDLTKQDFLRVGYTGLFFLDFLENIAEIGTEADLKNFGGSEANTGKKYGWLVNASAGKGLTAEPQFKIFTQDGEMKVFSVGDSLSVNGTTRLKDDVGKIISGQSNNPQGIWKTYRNPEDTTQFIQGVEPQLVKFSADATANVLTELWTAENQTGLPEDEKFGGSFSMDYYLNIGGYQGRKKVWNGTKEGGETIGNYGITYYRGGILFANVCILPKTPYFIIPNDVNKDKEYKVKDLTQEINVDIFRTLECLSFYDIDEDNLLGAMVQHSYLSGSDFVEQQYPNHSKNLSWGIVTNVSRVSNADGELLRVLSVCNNKGITTDFVYDEDLICGYKVAVADYRSDPDWYLKNGDNITYSPDISGTVRPDNMYIDIEKLDPGDMLSYLSDMSGRSLQVVNVIYRSNYPGMVAIGHNMGSIHPTLSDTNHYYGGELYINGIVHDKNRVAALVDVRLGNAMGDFNGLETVYAIPNFGKFMLWNTRTKTLTPISLDDLQRNDVVFSAWLLTDHQMLVAYR